MTPDTTPHGQSPEELESDARILDDHGNVLWAKELLKRAAELREQQQEHQS